MNNQFWFSTWLNTWFNVWGTNNGSWFHYVWSNANETLNNINSWQNDTKEKYNNAKNQEIARQAQNMYECSIRTDDWQVRKMNLSWANLNNMALLIKQTSKEQGYSSYDDLNPWETICRYLEKNPHRYQITKDTLDWIITLDDWAAETWVKVNNYINSEPTKVKEEDWNIITRILKNYIEPLYKHGWQMVSNLVNGSLEELEQWTVFNPWATDYTQTALENYAQMNYGTNFYWLTPEQQTEARNAVATDEWMEAYKPTIQRVLSRWAEAWVDAYFDIAWWPIMVLNSIWAEIPYVQDVIGAFGSILQFWWHIINSLPVLKQFRDSLQTEEEREERDQYVWGRWLWKLSWKKWKKANENIWDWIIKEIKDPKEIINRFKELPNKVGEKLPTASETIANMNKMTLEDKMSFKNKYGQDYGDFLNEKWIIEWREWTIEKLQYMKEENLAKIDKAIEEIEWDFYVWFEEIGNLIDDVMDYAEYTKENLGRPDVYRELKRIKEKFDNNWFNLSWKEILYMLRYFRRNNKLAYWKAANTTPLAVQRATNIESAASRRLSKIAEENWLENMREINKDISKSISILNALWKEQMKAYWDIPFSDWLQFYSLEQLPANILKTYLNSNKFKKSYAKWQNKRSWFKPKDVLDVDMNKIKESNAKRRVQNAYDSAMWDWTPRLNYEGPEVASDAANWAEMRAKDKPNPKDLVIETTAKDPWNVPKEVVEREPVKTINENPLDYRQKNLWDDVLDSTETKANKKNTKKKK